MSSQLSGFVSGLSGQVLTLETQNTDVLQQLLLKVGIDTFSTHNNSKTQEVSTLSASIAVLETKVNNLQQLYASVAYNHNQLNATFTGHTGQLTGAFVHGHS